MRIPCFSLKSALLISSDIAVSPETHKHKQIVHTYVRTYILCTYTYIHISELAIYTHTDRPVLICNQSINTEKKTTLIYVGKDMHAYCSHLTFEDVAVLQFSFSWSLAQPSDQLSLNYGLCRSTLSYTQGHTSTDSYLRTYVHTYIHIHCTFVHTRQKYVCTAL